MPTANQNPEQLVRDQIDKMLLASGWLVQSKTIERYETVHKGKEEYFYADLLSHLLKNKMEGEEKLVLNIAERGRSTKNNNLLLALEKAKERVAENINKKSAAGESKPITRHDIKTNVAFNVLFPTQDPLLNVADYFCWAVQRVFEKGEMRFYDYLLQQVSLVVDLYDRENFAGWKNYYNPKNPLTAKNKISPPMH